MNGHCFRFLMAIFLLSVAPSWLSSGVFAQDCGDFPVGGTLTGVVNTYYQGGTATAGATTIRVDTSGIRGSAARIAAGDMLLIIQMQDADINSSNTSSYGDGVASDPANGQTALNSAGYYEYVVARGAPDGSGNIDITGAGDNNGLLHTYRSAASTNGTNPDTPRRSFQVILVPRYKTATLSSGLTADYWDGTSGGVLALDITGTLTLGGTVSLDGRGFRGGAGRGLAGSTRTANTDYLNRATRNAHGSKGEGIVGTPYYAFGYNGTNFSNTSPTEVIGYPSLNTNADASQARGAPGNAGGGGTDGNPSANDQNSGGGGGGNGGTGGQGGRTWNSDLDRGGHPGAAFPYATGTNARLSMGGGGGAGSRNDSSGYQSAGGLGGGIVIIRATTVTGTGTITANGRGNDIPNIIPANDGGGGGGAGGSIVVVARNGNLAGLTVQANGGAGVNAWPTEAPGSNPGQRHGPGGGGGGGVILLSSAAASANATGGPAGITTTANDPFGATTGSLGVILSNVTMENLPGVESCDSTLASRATIRGLKIDPAGQVRFVTDSQHQTAAFQLWQTDAPENRTDMEPLTETPIASKSLFSMKPQIYDVQIAPITRPYLFIEEIEACGMRHLMGPFSVAEKLLSDEFDRVESQMRERKSRRSGPRKLAAASLREKRVLRNGATAIKIDVPAAGTVRLTGADLVAMGVPEKRLYASNSRFPNKQLKLTHLGEEIAYDFLPDQGDSGIFEFNAAYFTTDYTNLAVYVLSWPGTSTSGPPNVAFTRSGFSLPPGMMRIERNQFYAGFVPEEADPWIWTFIGAGASQTVSFDVPHLVDTGDPVPVRIGVVSATDHLHSLAAYLNGQYVGEASFSGIGTGEINGHVAAGTLLAAGNELRIDYSVADSGGNPSGLVFLDMIDVGVTTGPSDTRVEGSRLSPFDTSLPALRHVDYLILTHPLFTEGAERIAHQKKLEGFHPVVVDVERVYDRYSCGVVEAQAIRRFIQDSWRMGQKHLKYVLLIGDDTFDPNNCLGLDQMSFIPSLTGMDRYFGRIPSENLYADIDSDGKPEIAIGRLPVSTAEEMEIVTDKVLRQDMLVAAGRDTHLFAVDNQGADDPSFREMAESVSASLGDEKRVTWADVGEGAAAAHETLLNTIRDGAEAVHYFGHGGFHIWSDDGLLSASQADQLENSGTGAVVMTWTCNVQYFRHHLGPAINEALLLVPDGGAVATVGPVGVTKTGDQEKLYSLLYRHLGEGMTLGQAIQHAKADALTLGDTAWQAVEGWTLLGDPSIRLNWGNASPSERRGRKTRPIDRQFLFSKDTPRCYDRLRFEE